MGSKRNVLREDNNDERTQRKERAREVKREESLEGREEGEKEVIFFSSPKESLDDARKIMLLRSCFVLQRQTSTNYQINPKWTLPTHIRQSPLPPHPRKEGVTIVCSSSSSFYRFRTSFLLLFLPVHDIVLPPSRFSSSVSTGWSL